MPAAARLTLEQRRRVLEEDPLVSSLTDTSVLCAACDRFVALCKPFDFCNWNNHCSRHHGRTTGEIALMRAAARAQSTTAREGPENVFEDASDGTDELDVIDRALDARLSSPTTNGSEPPSTRASTANRSLNKEQRLLFLQNDPLVEEIEPIRILCKQCGSWIKLHSNSSYVLAHWKDHCTKKHKRSKREVASLIDLALGRQAITLITSEETLDEEDGSTQAEDDRAKGSSPDDDDSRNAALDPDWAFAVAFIDCDPLAGRFDAKEKTVHCIGCERPFALSKTNKLGNWHRHCASRAHNRTSNQRSCIERQAREALAGSSKTTDDGSDTSSTEQDDSSDNSNLGPPSAFLELDPLVAEYQKDRVRCKECNKWIKIASPQQIRHWHEHCGNLLHGRTQDEIRRMIREADARPSHDHSQAPTLFGQPQSLPNAPSPERTAHLSPDQLASHTLGSLAVRCDNSAALEDEHVGELPQQQRAKPLPTFKGVSREVWVVAPRLELNYDPLAGEVDGDKVKCRTCTTSYARHHWREHCHRKHGRAVEEQNELILRGREEAIRRAAAATEVASHLATPPSVPPLANNVALSPESPSVLPNGDAPATSPHSPYRVRHLTRRMLADIQQLEENDEDHVFTAENDAMDIDEQERLTFQTDVGDVSKNLSQPKALSTFRADDLALHQRFLQHDTLANKLDIRTQHVQCASCNKTISVRTRSGEPWCTFKYWNIHCKFTHGRNTSDVDKIMKLVANGSSSVEPQSSPTRPQKRPAQSDLIISPPAKRQRVTSLEDDKASMEVDHDAAVRARTGRLSQCNRCGNWIRHANFTRHFNDRCPQRTSLGAPVRLEARASRAASSTPEQLVSSPLPRFPMLAAPPSSEHPVLAAQSHNLSDCAGQEASHDAKKQAAFLFFLWTHNALAKIAYMQRQEELRAEAEATSIC